MRVLETLKILEEAVLDSKIRDIDTPEVREALDLLDPHCSPKWHVEGFRVSLRHDRRSGAELEGQQQVLRVYFGGIYRSVRALLDEQIGKLGGRYAKTKDKTVKAEIDRLTTALSQMPDRWDFRVR